MKLKEVEKLIILAKENGLAELSYKDKEGTEIKVKTLLGIQVTASPKQGIIPPISKAPLDSESEVDPSIKEVTSPFVGTFYRSSSPEANPYVKIGQKVNNGEVLCIIEAMKIMNEIESEFTGEIIEICTEDETYVEFGQVLFKIRI